MAGLQEEQRQDIPGSHKVYDAQWVRDRRLARRPRERAVSMCEGGVKKRGLGIVGLCARHGSRGSLVTFISSFGETHTPTHAQPASNVRPVLSPGPDGAADGAWGVDVRPSGARARGRREGEKGELLVASGGGGGGSMQ